MARICARRIIELVALGLMVSLGSGLQGQTSGDSHAGFPMTQGTSWTYRGVVRWEHGKDEKSSGARVTWKMEILRVIHREHITAAVVHGFPSELNWSTGNSVPLNSLLIQTDGGEIYHIDAEQMKPIVDRLDDASDKLEDLLHEDDIFVRVPLEKGKKFCDADSLARDDGMYCWVVSAADKAPINDVKGLDPAARDLFEIRYVTNPDDITIKFTPGVGITSYAYHHHGTTADTELKLVEFHPGP